MGRYWNALRYGNKATKLYLWAVIVGAVLTVAFTVAAFAKLSWTVGLVALFFAVVTLIIWQSRDLTDKDFLAEGKGEGEKKPAKKKEKKDREKKGEDRDEVKVGDPEEADRAEEGEEEEGSQEDEAGSKKGKKPGGKKEKKEKKGTAGDFSHYTNKKIEQMLHHFHVRRIHRTIMIDSFESEGIYQCPAYLWKERKKVYLLVLEETPRRLRFQWAQMVNMTYMRGVPADPKREYESVRKPSLVNAVFAGFLPTYHEERVNAVTMYRKNLYRLGEDLLLTNTSVPNVMEVLSPSFHVEDEVTKEPSHSNYFVEMYQQNLLLRDGVLTAQEYKQQIRAVLTLMAQDKMGFDEFVKNLEQMTDYRLITQEYADFYLDYRKKWLQKNAKLWRG